MQSKSEREGGCCYKKAVVSYIKDEQERMGDGIVVFHPKHRRGKMKILARGRGDKSVDKQIVSI